VPCSFSVTFFASPRRMIKNSGRGDRESVPARAPATEHDSRHTKRTPLRPRCYPEDMRVRPAQHRRPSTELLRHHARAGRTKCTQASSLSFAQVPSGQFRRPIPVQTRVPALERRTSLETRVASYAAKCRPPHYPAHSRPNDHHRADRERHLEITASLAPLVGVTSRSRAAPDRRSAPTTTPARACA
jgi:hypothetical protein